MEPRFDVESAPSPMERIIAATPRVVLGAAFITIGWSKFQATSSWVQLFARIGLGDWFRYFTGALQLLGGVLALVPRTAFIGAAMIACTMGGAVVVDLFVLQLGPVAIIPGALFAVAAGVAWQAWNR